MIASAKPRRTREEQAAASRQQILDAALRLFADHGFAGTSTKRIAKKAQVSEGLIFHHFPSKQDLLRSIVTTRRTMPAVLAQLLRSAPNTPVVQFVETVATRFVELLRPGQPEAQLFRVILGEANRDAELHAMVQGIQSELFGAVADYLRTRIDAGELREDLAPETATRCLFGALLVFFVANQREGAETWDARGTVHAKGVVEFWLQGALSSARPDARSFQEDS